MKRVRPSSQVEVIDEAVHSFFLQKIISGGQTGADQAALEAAELLGIPTGGFAPPNYMTSDGPNWALRDRFHLEEMRPPRNTPDTVAYVQRSKKNVDEADATLAFRLQASAGTDKTIGYCKTGFWGPSPTWPPVTHRPCLVVRSLGADEETHQKNIEAIRKFLRENRVRTLNVCGHRAAPPTCPQYTSRIKELLQDALKDLVPPTLTPTSTNSKNTKTIK